MNRKLLFLLICSVIILFSCSKNKETDIIKNENEPIKEVVIPLTKEELQINAIENYVNTMSLEQKIAQMFLISVDGTKSDVSAKNYDIPPGGYILFQYNTIDGAEAFIDLIGETKVHYATKNQVVPFFSIDHEGGVVHRLRDIASPLASASSIATYASDEVAYELYAYHAQQLKALGIDINLGPMAEISYDSNKLFTSTRSFGTKEKVITYGKIFIDAFNDNDVYCVLKHFPGNTNDDPHYSLPVLNGTKEEISDLYIEPFEHLLHNQGILMSHAIVPAFDEVNPACLSENVVTNLLLDDLAFNGLVFSDEILMDALSQNGFPPEIAIPAAINAGVNVLMIADSNFWYLVELIKEKIVEEPGLLEKIDISNVKILQAKIEMGLYTVKNDTLETAIFVSESNDALYNKENQLERFNKAKQKGDELYYTYWK